VIDKIFKNRSNNIILQAIKYLFVGGAAFLVDFSVLFLLRLIPFIDKYYLIANSAGVLCGLITNYLLSILWVFPHRTLKSKWLEFLIFSIIGIIGLGLNNLILWAIYNILVVIDFKSLLLSFLSESVSSFFIKTFIPKAIATVIVLIWNFLLRKFLLFNPKLKDILSKDDSQQEEE